jgi:hypothetical protein
MKKLFNQYRMLFVAAVLFWMFFGTAADPSAMADEGTITISGKVTSVAFGMFTPFGNRRAELVIEDKKGKTHVVHVGQKTAYIPHRTPAAGDKVSIVCVRKNGALAGVTVTYK